MWGRGRTGLDFAGLPRVMVMLRVFASRASGLRSRGNGALAELEAEAPSVERRHVAGRNGGAVDQRRQKKCRDQTAANTRRPGRKHD